LPTFVVAFIEAYGTNGQAAFDKALGEARSMQQQATGPKGHYDAAEVRLLAPRRFHWRKPTS